MKGFESYLNASDPREGKALSYIEATKGRVPDATIEQIESDPEAKEEYLKRREGESEEGYRTRLLNTAEKLYVEQKELELAAARKRELRRELSGKASGNLDRQPQGPLAPELRSAFEEMSKGFRSSGSERLASLIDESLREDDQ